MLAPTLFTSPTPRDAITSTNIDVQSATKLELETFSVAKQTGTAQTALCVALFINHPPLGVTNVADQTTVPDRAIA